MTKVFLYIALVMFCAYLIVFHNGQNDSDSDTLSNQIVLQDTSEVQAPQVEPETAASTPTLKPFNLPAEYLIIEDLGQVRAAPMDSFYETLSDEYKYFDSMVENDTTLYDSLPPQIVDYLKANQIKVAHSSAYGHCTSYVRGEFYQRGQMDLAVACSKMGRYWITIFWNESPEQRTILSNIALSDVGHTDENKIIRKISLAGINHFISYNEFDDGFSVALEESFATYEIAAIRNKPDQFDHDGIFDFTVPWHGERYFYFVDNTLMAWGDGVPGLERWLKEYENTIQDSLLLSPLDCTGLPVNIGNKLAEQNMQVITVNGSACCSALEFFQPGTIDYALTTTDLDRIYLVIFKAGDPSSMISVANFHISTFRYCEFEVMKAKDIAQRIESHFYFSIEEYTGIENYPFLSADSSGFTPPFDTDGLAFYFFPAPSYNEGSEWVYYYQNGKFWELYYSPLE